MFLRRLKPHVQSQVFDAPRQCLKADPLGPGDIDVSSLWGGTPRKLTKTVRSVNPYPVR